jgi:hypothetical protein
MLPKYLRKLKKLSVDELRVRSSQELNAFAERLGWSSLTTLPDDQGFLTLLDPERTGFESFSPAQFLQHFRSRSEPRFFTAFSNKVTTIEELRQRWPSSESEIVAEAELILQGRFSLLGFRDLSFGNPIDWHLEPNSGKLTPRDHWSTLDYLDPGIAGDKKVTWELNRHQYFMTLGRAYWLTGDERFANAFAEHLESWMEQNPPKQGINWSSSLEVSFRLISWIFAFYFFQDSPSLKPKTFVRAMKFLYLHARHLETYLSTYFSPNTHLTGEALGLFYAGTLLPEFKDAGRWKAIGRDVLLTQLSRQVRPDGVYFEQSSYYHRYTIDFFHHFVILSQLNGEVLPAEVEGRLQALLDHLMYITRPDGTTPFYGDDDGGRLVKLDQIASNDFRACLTTGAVLFNRQDYRFVAANAAEETLWLLGQSGLDRFDSLEPREPVSQSVAFENGGYYVMRDSWTAKANYLLFDCGPHGALSYGHAHADALSFEIAVNGRTLLIDPGTYTYTGSKKLRDWFRSSAAHNTLTMDGKSSSLPDGPFSWQRVAKCATRKWISRERFDYVAGSCESFSHLPQSVTHTRSIFFLKNDYWIIRDQVINGAGHRADVSFHFDQDAKPLIDTSENRPFITENDNEESADVFAFGRDGRWRREDGWVSHCYGEKAPGRVYTFSVQTGGFEEIVTFLMPCSAGATKRSVGQIEAIGGKAFEVTHQGGSDVVMIRDAQAARQVEMKRLASDFAWTWVRFSGEEKTLPIEIVLLDGTTLEFEGRQVLKSDDRLEYLRATRVGDQFRVETNSGVSDSGWDVADFAAALSGEKSGF